MDSWSGGGGWVLAVPDGVLLESGLTRRLPKGASIVRLVDGGASVIWGPTQAVASWIEAGCADDIPTQAAPAGLLLDAQTPIAAARTRRILLSRSGKPSDGPVSRRLNRPLSRQFTRLFLFLGLSPYFASLICLLVGLASGWFAAQPDPASLALAGFLYQFASMFDGVDDEMARINLSDSQRGAWVDTSIDYFTHLIALVGLLIGWLRSDASQVEALGLIAILAGLFLVLGAVARLVRRHGPPGEAMLLTHFSIWVGKAAQRPGCPLTLRMANALFPIVRRDMVAFLLMLATFTGHRETLGLLVAFGLGIGAYALVFHRQRIVAESGWQPA